MHDDQVMRPGCTQDLIPSWFSHTYKIPPFHPAHVPFFFVFLIHSNASVIHYHTSLHYCCRRTSSAPDLAVRCVD